MLFQEFRAEKSVCFSSLFSAVKKRSRRFKKKEDGKE
jgi:hypothetical protein